MGFAQVYDYTAGKLDWLAAGLATEGSNALRPRAGDVARHDVPTCGLDERLGEVAGRVRAAGWDACVVVNVERVVLGLLRGKELEANPGLRIEQAMRPGPSTFRPYVSIAEMAKFMADHDVACSRCARPIDRCEFCEATDCRTPVCYGCLQVALVQALPQPHPHGG